MRYHRTVSALALFASCLLVAAPGARAAEPPELINYQGVLRAADDAPLGGSHDMVFRFWSAAVGGSEILVDTHTAAVGAAVTVTGGLFNVQLGGGTVSDGSGPGTYTTLSHVFRDYAEVWLAIQVGAETLSPRVRVVASPYAANAMHLGGKRANQFVDTAAGEQAKLGKLVLGQGSGTYPGYAFEAYGSGGGAYFGGGSSGRAHIAVGHRGIDAYGSDYGGYFKDWDGTGSATLGNGDTGISATGNFAGGHFQTPDGSSFAYLASSGYGISGYGNTGGGYFNDPDSSGLAYIAAGDYGVQGFGNTAGGYFVGTGPGGSGSAYVGYGNRGIHALGNEAGGYFKDANNSGYAFAGWGDRGIEAQGNEMGGHFKDANGSGYAYVGWGDRGIHAHGNEVGGYFSDLNESGRAYVGYSSAGIQAAGNSWGGFFQDSDHSGLGYVGVGDRGIWGKGTFAGGTFSHPDNVTFWADVSTSTRKIVGTGTVSFVQNHPVESDKVVVYAAPEGDEVAVYTRGTARLAGGEARVRLGETFALVANPDIGLTVHLTPRGEPVALAATEVSTEEIVVRGPAGSDATFDYLVYGLRLGFEELAIVQPKTREAFLPARAAVEEPYRERPELRRFSAFERFRGMRAAVGRGEEVDLSRTRALVAAIDDRRAEAAEAGRTEAQAERSLFDRPAPSGNVPPARPPARPATVTGPAPVTIQTVEPAATNVTWLPAGEPVEEGDVLALDPFEPGRVRRAASLADAGVVGIAAGSSRPATDGGLEAPVAAFGIVTVRADAGYGAIRPGDLLAASPTPGHAMRALEAIPGTILGKAIDALDGGTDTIRVLLSPR